MVTGNRGRELKPRLNKIVLFFKNIDLCWTDKWGTCEIIELLIELIQRNGFYNDDLEWIHIMGLTVCCSMTSAPKDNVSPRLLSILINFFTEYPDDNELNLIVKNHFWPIGIKFNQIDKSSKFNQIIQSSIQIYQYVSNTWFLNGLRI